MDNGKVLLGVLAGVAAGATLGILFAPDSGANTRKKIARKGEDYANNLKDKYNGVIDSLGHEVDMFKDEMNELVASGKSKLEEEKTKANNVKNDIAKSLS